MFSTVYISDFPFLSRNVMSSAILDIINALILSLFDNDFVYWKIIIVKETVSPER